MPPGHLPRPSMILCDYVKNVDYRERSATFLKELPDELVDEVIGQLLDLVDPMQQP